VASSAARSAGIVVMGLPSEMLLRQAGSGKPFPSGWCGAQR
jgi:hypothetical protein